MYIHIIVTPCISICKCPSYNIQYKTMILYVLIQSNSNIGIDFYHIEAYFKGFYLGISNIRMYYS